jgi:hypothetical protein
LIWINAAGSTGISQQKNVQQLGNVPLVLSWLAQKWHRRWTIDDPETIYDPDIWDTPGFTSEMYSFTSGTILSAGTYKLDSRQ